MPHSATIAFCHNRRNSYLLAGQHLNIKHVHAETKDRETI